MIREHMRLASCFHVATMGVLSCDGKLVRSSLVGDPVALRKGESKLVVTVSLNSFAHCAWKGIACARKLTALSTVAVSLNWRDKGKSASWRAKHWASAAMRVAQVAAS